MNNNFTLHTFRGKRWTFCLTAWLLLCVSVHLYFQGLFLTKKDLVNKSIDYWQNDTFWQESKFFKRN